MNARSVNRLAEGWPNNLVYKAAAFNADITMFDRPIVLALSGGFTITLPKSRGQGVRLWFIVGIVSTTGYVFNTNGSDVFAGGINMNKADTATPANGYAVSTANKTLTLNGTTQGGVAIGDQFTLTDILSGTWAVAGAVTYSGSIATPFSN